MDKVYLVYFDNGDVDEWNRHHMVAVYSTETKAEEYAKECNEKDGLEKPDQFSNTAHSGWFYVEEQEVLQ